MRRVTEEEQSWTVTIFKWIKITIGCNTKWFNRTSIGFMKQPLNESIYSRSVIVVDLYSRNELEWWGLNSQNLWLYFLKINLSTLFKSPIFLHFLPNLVNIVRYFKKYPPKTWINSQSLASVNIWYPVKIFQMSPIFKFSVYSFVVHFLLHLW